MKRLLSLMLAAAMVLSIGAMTVSAADIDYPVAFVWDTGFLKDEDGVLQIGEGDGVSSVPYGSTVYFPLINTNYENHNELVPFQNALEEAKRVQKEKTDALTAAKTAKETALTSQTIVDLANDLAAKESALDTAEAEEVRLKGIKDEAERALNSATGTPANVADAKTAVKNAIDSLVDKIDDLLGDSTATDASQPDDVNSNYYQWKRYYESLVTSTTTQIGNLEIDFKSKIDAINARISDADAASRLNKDTLPNVVDLEAKKNTDGPIKTLWDANSENFQTAYTDLITVATNYEAAVANKTTQSAKVNEVTTKINTLEEENSVLNGYSSSYPSAVESYYEGNQTDAEAIINKLSSINTAYSFGVAIPNLSAYAGTPADTTELQEAFNTAKNNHDAAVIALTNATTARDNAETAYNNAIKPYDDDIAAKQAAKDAADAAVTTAQNNLNNAMTTVGNAFVFVTESAAVSNAKVKADWEYGSKYVDKIELDKVKATSTEFGMGGTTKSIYCIAVTLEESKSTDEVEVEGEIAISKSGSNGYSLADTAAYISLTVGAPIADPDSEITATPQLFEEDYSFDAEEDHIFYFEEDSSSWFEVNTKSQKDIVLAFDTEWDDDLADEIYEKNPNADLDFYNGNYAKFSKTGTLWLGYPEDDADDAYVYAVSSSGKLSLVNAEYDDYEEAFAIRTNTLGRYVISTEKLKLSSTSSGGSGSGTGTGTGTVVSSSKSSAAAPVSSSKPASSTPVSSSKPASSTPASSQVSSQESSKESKPSSEPLSIKEPSSEEDNKHVSGTTDPEDNDVPTKKGGVSWIVWLLILAGLVAVVIAVGVIFYTKKNSGRRML